MSGQQDSPIHLFTDWLNGAEILAGTCRLSTTPPPARCWRDCNQPGCHVTVFGDSELEAIGRLAVHRRRCHG